MSGFICPKCQTESDIFGSGTCEDLAKEYGTQVLANIPIEPAIRESGDTGKPIVYFAPETTSAKRYMRAAEMLWENIQQSQENGNIGNEAIQPNMPAGVSACSTAGASQASKSGGCGSHGGDGQDGCGCSH
jgi:ATP-binding protein involved in chromosome partitioning